MHKHVPRIERSDTMEHISYERILGAELNLRNNPVQNPYPIPKGKGDPDSELSVQITYASSDVSATM